MPNIIITEEEFKKLTDDTKKEIWSLLKDSFSNTTVSDELSDDNLGNRLKNSIKENQLNFDTLSIETAIAVLIGLSTESRKVVEALCKSQQSRENLTEILGNEKKINGTIGSINRRLAKRLDEKIYGKRRDRVKLIEFDGDYRLTCNSRALELASLIIGKGYKIGEGDIILRFKEGAEFKAEAKIEEESIIRCDEGYAYCAYESWDYEIDHVSHQFRVNVVYSEYTDKVVISTVGEDEWATDSVLGDFWSPYGDPDEVLIGGKKR